MDVEKLVENLPNLELSYEKNKRLTANEEVSSVLLFFFRKKP